MEVVPIEITRNEFQEFRELQRRHRWDWPAAFSTNRQSEIWAYITNGHTPFELREKNLRNVSPMLDIIANKYLMARPEVGRFFIDERGAFYKDELSLERQFVIFDWVD